MTKILVIVESPGKIQKIQKLLKKIFPENDYIVSASVGHIIDLDKKTLSVDIENNFTPSYCPMDNKKKIIIKNLKSQYKSCDDILLATDEDREGEMIAWSIAESLKIKKPKRIIFNSITENELKKAVNNPTIINDNMVNAQKTRRILDRIVGYKISPILWKTANQSLSAGRVQSVVVKLIIDKENEINDFLENKLYCYYKIISNFNYKFEELQCNLVTSTTNLTKVQILELNEAKKIMKLLVKSKYTVIDIKKKIKTQNPSPPFTTSTLQQEAARKLGYPVKKTMMSAQKLYEYGYITYMRTDSMNLSQEAISKISKFVIKEYGKEYLKIRNFKTKSKNTQEAHEAIRPSNIDARGVKMEGKLGSSESKLYNLIWKRSVASQMEPAKFNNTTIIVEPSSLKKKNIKYVFMTDMDELIYDGFLAVYNYKDINKDEQDIEKEKLLNKIPKINEKLELNNLSAINDYNKPPLRYNEASLINKLDPKNLNIGRPSTYATIIDKIQFKKYVVKENKDGIEKDIYNIYWDEKSSKLEYKEDKIIIGKENNKLIPTDMGTLITSFLVKNFPDIMEYKFTANLESKLDDIAEGNKIWYTVLDDFYKKFHPLVVNAQNTDINILDTNSRELGVHPDSNNKIIATINKYGGVVKMKDSSSAKIIYAPIKKPLTLKSITLADAVKLFEYPKNIGKLGKKHVHLYKGKFGLYLKIGSDNYSLAKEEIDEDNINIDYVKKIVDKHNEKYLWTNKDDKYTYKILNGPYGMYVSVKNNSTKTKPYNVSLSNDIDLKKLTLDNLKEIINKKKPYKKIIKSKK